MQAVAQSKASDFNRLPTIDDFVQALQSIRSSMTQNGEEPTLANLRPALQRFAQERREQYLSGATNSFDLERRVREWDRAQFSGLFTQQ
jgi:hypothetical protein